MVDNARQLIEAVTEAGGLIQQISDFVAKQPRYGRLARIRFPRGFIKPAADIRMNLRFISDEMDDWYKATQTYRSLRDGLNKWRGTMPA